MGSALERHTAGSEAPAGRETARELAAAVRFYAKLGGQPSPVGLATERVLAGFRREGRGRGQVVGVRWEQADAAAGSSGGSVRGLRDAALLAVMSDGLLRVSEADGVEAAGIAGGPMFQRLDKAGRPRGRLSTVSVRAIVQRRDAAAGVEGRVSGHSLRVGGAQSLAAAGASIVEMQTADRWQSPSMPSRYARGQLAARGAVAKLRYGA